MAGDVPLCGTVSGSRSHLGRENFRDCYFLPHPSACAVQETTIVAIHECAGATDEITDACTELTVGVPFLGNNLSSEQRNSDLALRCAGERSIQRLESTHVQKAHFGRSATCNLRVLRQAARKQHPNTSARRPDTSRIRARGHYEGEGTTIGETRA